MCEDDEWVQEAEKGGGGGREGRGGGGSSMKSIDQLTKLRLQN